MNAPLVVEIRYWPDPTTGKRYAQYRVRGGSSLVWVPMGMYVAQEAIRVGLFHGLRVEEVPTGASLSDEKQADRVADYRDSVNDMLDAQGKT